MLIHTLIDPFMPLFSAVVTASSITAPSATTTEPSGDGIFLPRAMASNSALVSFFGGNSDNGTFTARLTGWRRIGTLWVPTPLLALSGVLGAMTGVSGAAVTNSQLFADTLAVTTAFTSAYEVISPTGDQIAAVKVDLFGCEKLQVQLAKGTCDGVGALAAAF